MPQLLPAEVEKHSPQTDLEALAIVWASGRCYKYLIESSFIVETDHQPLIQLFNNPHSRPPPPSLPLAMRIERWLLYIQQFDYQLKLCPRKQNAADYLSRHLLPFTESDVQTSKARKQVVQSIITDTVPHPISLTDIQAATRKDQELGKLIPLIQSGNHRACKSDPDLAKYVLVFRHLSYTEGVLNRGHQLVIPKSLPNSPCDQGYGYQELTKAWKKNR